MKIIYNNAIPFKGFRAINLFGVIFARKQYRPLCESTLRHEAIHAAQMREMLYIGFYLWYGVEWLLKLPKYGKKAYENLCFEREAYRNGYNTSYLKTRCFWSWRKYLKKK